MRLVCRAVYAAAVSVWATLDIHWRPLLCGGGGGGGNVVRTIGFRPMSSRVANVVQATLLSCMLP